jgi:hypothetical protein
MNYNIASCNGVFKYFCFNTLFQIEINKELEEFFTLLYGIIRDFCEKLFRFWFLSKNKIFEMFRFVVTLQNLTPFGTNIEVLCK